jgi:hypothetical protein
MRTWGLIPLSFRRAKFLTLLFAVALAPVLLVAQGYFGTVSGELTDATGAVIPGAQVVLSDQQKGFTFTTTSDSNGRYLFRSIPSGVYSVSAEARGFDKAVSAKFKLDINENSTTNLSLKVAGASQTIQIGAEAQTIQTEDAETGQVVNRKFINDLPLIDRNVIALTSLAPGVTAMDDQCDATCTGTNFVVQRKPRLDRRHSDRWRFRHEFRTERRRHPSDLSAISGSDRRIQGAADQLQRRVWILRSVRGQHDHALGDEPVPRQRVRFRARFDLRRERLVLQPFRTASPPASPQQLRRDHWRSDHQEQDILLRSTTTACVLQA